MTPRDIAHSRLVNQQIAQPMGRKPHEVVASLGAMQAQDYLGALWGIGLRLADATEADIEQAIADRTIIRTWPMRGTLHFLAARDVRWMLELLAPRTIASAARRHQQLELDDAVFARSKKLFISALQGGRQLTRNELSELLERAHISTANQRGYHILWWLAHDGVICFGARQGKQPTFVLLDEWLPNARSLAHDEALAEVTRRYFTGHGPATLPDFVRWSGLKNADAQTGLEMVSSQLAHETIDGNVYWMPQGVSLSRQVSPTAYLLPGFDEWMLGYKDRSASLDPQHAPKITPGDNGRFSPTIVIGGRVAGTWKRTLKKNAVVITPSIFTSLNKTQTRAVAAAAERYGRFLGLSVQFADSQ
jgi:hypothetical protein